MRNLPPIFSLVLASSASAYNPFRSPQQPLRAGVSQERYDGYQVWRLDWRADDQSTRDDIRQAINVGLIKEHVRVENTPNDLRHSSWTFGDPHTTRSI